MEDLFENKAEEDVQALIIIHFSTVLILYPTSCSFPAHVVPDGEHYRILKKIKNPDLLCT